MSYLYDEYLYDHISGVRKAFEWLCEHEIIPKNTYYTQEELDLFDSLLVEAIGNIKVRELIEKNVSRYTEERKKGD